MKRTVIITLTIVLALSLSQAVNAQGRFHKGRMGFHSVYSPLIHAPWTRVRQISDEIGLNDSQLEQLKQIRYDYRHQVQSRQNQVKLIMRDMVELIESGDAGSSGQAMKYADQVTDLKGKILKDKITQYYEISKLLTDEQKTKLRRMKPFWGREGKRGRHRRGNRAGRGFGYQTDVDPAMETTE